MLRHSLLGWVEQNIVTFSTIIAILTFLLPPTLTYIPIPQNLLPSLYYLPTFTYALRRLPVHCWRAACCARRCALATPYYTAPYSSTTYYDTLADFSLLRIYIKQNIVQRNDASRTSTGTTLYAAAAVSPLPYTAHLLTL